MAALKAATINPAEFLRLSNSLGASAFQASVRNHSMEGAIFADDGSLIINTATFANNFAIGGNGGDGGQTNGGCGMHGAGGLAYGGAITNNAATANA